MEASNERKNEAITHNPIISLNGILENNSKIKLDSNIINTSKSVSRIRTKEKDGTGFLLKTFKDNIEFYCLITNEHIVTKNMIDTKQKIVIYYDTESESREIILNKEQRFIKEYRNMDIDITLIEILKEDNINKKYFLLPYTGNNNIINKDKNIYIIQYPSGDLSYSKGKIKNIDKFEITHDAGTKEGSSGSPIFLENTKFVIGIHKQGNNKKKENYGDLLYPIIIDLKPRLNYEDGFYYKGDIINGKEHGKGILYYKN